MKTHPLGESIGLEDRPHTPWRVAAIVALVLGTLALGAVGGAQVLHAGGVQAAATAGPGGYGAGGYGPGGMMGRGYSNGAANGSGYGPGGMMGGNGNGGYGPGGMMGGNGGNGGYGPGGMMGGGYGPGCGGNPGAPATGSGTRLGGDQVRQAVTSYLTAYYPGQDLAIDEIMEFQNNFYAQIREGATGPNAFELLVDPVSGSVWPEYGPNMMWNTKYGHMASGGRGGMMGGYAPTTQPTTAMPITPDQAVATARAYLQAQGGGLTTEDQPDVFYGYYTIDTLQNGQTAGMLSVNGYTGAVWVHTWHGAFLGMVGSGN